MRPLLRLIPRLVLAVTALAAVLAVLFAAAVFLSPGFAGFVAERYLARAGYVAPEVEISSLGLGGVRLTRFALGAGPDLLAEDVALSYEPAGLLRGAFDTLSIGRLRLRAGVDADGVAIAGMPAAAEQGAEGTARIPAFSDIRIRETALEVVTPYGSAAGDIDLAVSQNAGELGISFARPATITGTLREGMALAVSLRAETPGAPIARYSVADGGFAVGLLADVSAGALEISGAAISAATAADGLGGVGISLEVPFGYRLGDTQVDGGFDARLAIAQEAGRMTIRLPDCAQLVSQPLVLGAQELRVPAIALCPDESGEALVRSADGGGYVMAARLPGVAVSVLTGGTSFVQGETPEIALTGGFGGAEPGALLRIAADAAGGQLVLPGYAVAVEDIALSAAASLDAAGDLAASAAIDRMVVNDVAEVRRVAPLTLKGNVRLDGGDAEFAANLRALDTLVLEVDGRGALGDLSLAANYRVPRLAFVPKGLQPQRLFPVLRGQVIDAVGAVAAKGKVAWRDGALSGTSDIALDDLGFRVMAARIDGIKGGIKLTELLPPSGPPRQHLKIGKVDPGLPLENGDIYFTVDRGILKIDEGRWPWAGGVVELTSGDLELGAPEQRFTLTAKSVDVTRFLKLIDVPGLSGTGFVSGAVPVEISGGEVFIRNALLKAEEDGGSIAYVSDTGEAASAASTESSILFDALKDFRYEVMQIEVDGKVTDKLAVKLKLHGSSPNVYDGFPINLNVTLEDALLPLLRRATIGYRAIDLIREKGEERGYKIDGN